MTLEKIAAAGFFIFLMVAVLNLDMARDREMRSRIRAERCEAVLEVMESLD